MRSREALRLGRVRARRSPQWVERDSNPDKTSGPNVADRRVDDADRATKDDAKQREVSASATPSTEAAAPPLLVDTDEAIRTAAKVAIDAGDVDRARALLDLLDAKPKPAAVLTLATRKPAR